MIVLNKLKRKRHTMKAFNLIIILLLTIIIGSCNLKNDSKYDNIDQMLTDAEASITKVSINNLKEKLDHKGEYIIIDCRETAEFIEGHIPGSINIPRGVIEFSSKISNRREIIYIYSQTNDRASLAFSSLKLLKYNSIYLIDGGWEEWIKIYPEIVEKGQPTMDTTPPKVEEAGGCGG